MENGLSIEAASEVGKRKKIRLCYLAAVKITTSDGKVIRANLRDIGIESLFAKFEKNPKKNYAIEDYVDIEISVNQGASRLTISTSGKILREDEDGVAILFVEPLKWWPIFSVFPVNEHFLFDIVAKA